MEEKVLHPLFEKNPSLRTRGFLPAEDPLTHFPTGMHCRLDSYGEQIPARAHDDNFRNWASELSIPFPGERFSRRELELYYVRLSFLASAYVHQVGKEPARILPKNIAVPLVQACKALQRLPILSYDGYALYNWKRLDPKGPVALGHIDTFQNFVQMYDEHWFILIHVDIEQKAAAILDAIARWSEKEIGFDEVVAVIRDTVLLMREVLLRIPEHMNSDLYFSTFRPYINGYFHGVVYEGVSAEAQKYRGETGAQSSIMPLLETFLKIPHQPSILTEHLRDMRNFMPAEHRELLEVVDLLPSPSGAVSKEIWNGALEAIAGFREVHLRWSQEYINRHGGSKGTGGTPYMKWLAQLIEETLAARK